MRVLALLACLALPCSVLFAQPAQTGAAPAVVGTTPATQPVPATTPASAQQAAIVAAEAWMKLVDEEKYDEMFQGLDPLAMSMVAQDTFISQVSAVRESMGKLQSRAFTSAEHHTSLPGMPDGSFYILRFSSSFQNKKQGVETAVMREERGTWRVAGYFIR